MNLVSAKYLKLPLDWVAPSTEKLPGLSTEMYFTVIIDFMPFHVLSNAVPVEFKLIIVVVSFTLLQNCR